MVASACCWPAGLTQARMTQDKLTVSHVLCIRRCFESFTVLMHFVPVTTTGGVINPILLIRKVSTRCLDSLPKVTKSGETKPGSEPM